MNDEGSSTILSLMSSVLGIWFSINAWALVGSVHAPGILELPACLVADAWNITAMCPAAVLGIFPRPSWEARHGTPGSWAFHLVRGLLASIALDSWSAASSDIHI